MQLNDLSLYATAMSPSGEGWAVGSMYSKQNADGSIILHYHGGKWVVSLLAGLGWDRIAKKEIQRLQRFATVSHQIRYGQTDVRYSSQVMKEWICKIY